MLEPSGLDHPTDPHLQLFRLKDIPPAPGILQQAMRVVSDEQADLREMAAVIDRSPELAARILRCANSSYYGQRRRIVTVEDAIIRVLGLSTTKGLVLAMALSQSFNPAACPNFQAERHWFTAVVTADLAEKLAGHLDPRPSPPGTAYAAGLLHNLGLLALVHTYPQRMSLLFGSEEEGDLGTRLCEAFGLDHHQAGARLALKWGLPELFIQVVEHHHDPAYRHPGWQLVMLVAMAKEIAETLFAGGSLSALPVDLRGLSLPGAEIERAIAQVGEKKTELLDLAHQLAGKGGT